METTARQLIDLRATVAMRAEDLRIARKHRIEAVSHAAFRSALAWETACRERERAARAALDAA